MTDTRLSRDVTATAQFYDLPGSQYGKRGLHNTGDNDVYVRLDGNDGVLAGDADTLDNAADSRIAVGQMLDIGANTTKVAYVCATGLTSTLRISVGGDLHPFEHTPADGSVGAEQLAAGAAHATVVVAASDAMKKVKSSADYSCDGTADEIEINQAITAASTAGGGIVFLSEGTFTVVATILVKSNVVLQGSGWATIITLPDAHSVSGHPIVANENWTEDTEYLDFNIQIRDMQIDGNSTNIPANASYVPVSLRSIINFKVVNCHIHHCKSHGIFVNHKVKNGFIDANVIHDYDAVYNASAAGIYLAAGLVIPGVGTWVVENILVTRNIVHDMNYGIRCGGRRCTIQQNVCYGNADDGIAVIDGWENSIIGNHCIENDFNGIIIESSTPDAYHGAYNTITGNTCIGNGVDTYSDTDAGQIKLGATAGGAVYAHHNIVQGNICRIGDTVADSDDYDIHGILVSAATVADNIIVGNECEDGFYSGSGEGFPIKDDGVRTRIENNSGDEPIVTSGAVTLTAWGATSLDSNGGAITGTLGSGSIIGQVKTIVMTEASNSSTVSVTNHVTSDPEVFTFDAIDETLILQWTGTEWVTIYATATT